jgi:hypothetical protein
MSSQVPSIAAIQRTTAIVLIATAGVVLVAASPASAIGCLIGGALMIMNLYVLNLIGRAIVSIARQEGGASVLGLIAAPLKMLILAGIVYLVIESGRVNIAGFIAGSLTQFAAIFIEIWRAAKWNSRGQFASLENNPRVDVP